MRILNSLVARFFLATILFFILFTVIITYLVNSSQQDYCLQNFSAKSGIYKRIFESQLSSNGNSLNFNSGEFSFLKSDPVLLYVNMHANDGSVLNKFSAKNLTDYKLPESSGISSDLLTDKMVVRDYDDVIEIITPLMSTDENIGFATFGFSKHNLNDSIHNFRYTVFYYSLVIFAFGLISAFISMRVQSRPIKEFIAKIKLIASGNLDQKVEVSPYTELRQLSVSFNEMTEKLKEVRQSLIYEKERAEQSSKLKTEFLAQMSHEIRSPINTILSFTSLMREDLEESLPEEYDDYFTSINNAGNRITRTIDMILDLSEIQTGTYETKFMIFDIFEEVLTYMVNEYRNPARKKGLSIELQNKADNTMLYADQYMISQVFQNLIDNAIKYSKKGTILIKINDLPDDKLMIEVADNGIGISNEFIENLFEPFRQEEQGYSRHFEGSGLGLALVKKYCELNDAEISVKSEKGVGTTFTFIIKKYIPENHIPDIS